MSIETSRTIKRRDTPYKSRRSTIYGPFTLSGNRVISVDGRALKTRLLHENMLSRQHIEGLFSSPSLPSRVDSASNARFNLQRYSRLIDIILRLLACSLTNVTHTRTYACLCTISLHGAKIILRFGVVHCCE